MQQREQKQKQLLEQQQYDELELKRLEFVRKFERPDLLTLVPSLKKYNNCKCVNTVMHPTCYLSHYQCVCKDHLKKLQDILHYLRGLRCFRVFLIWRLSTCRVRHDAQAGKRNSEHC